jgi:hypothetical protein
MHPTHPALRWFPLVARPRPACTPLDERIGALHALARSADRDDDQAAASAVYNQAALVASDIGLPDLARVWCLRHAAAYLRAAPLKAPAARHALEPFVNLARLHIRDGNGDKAFQLLNDLYQAITTHTDIVIGGLPVPTSALTATPGDHMEVRRWLWSVLLADGTRALTSSGRWHDALIHIQQHKGIGQRMLDGRQVAIISHATTGDLDRAFALLETTVPGEPRENAVTTCLTMLCRRHAGQPVDQDLAAMLDSHQQVDHKPQLAVFDTRLRLSAIDAVGDMGTPAARALIADLFNRTALSRDGYAARDLLAYNGRSRILKDRQTRELTKMVKACALGSRTIPGELRTDLLTAMDTSDAVVTRTLAACSAAPGRRLLIVQ